MAFVFRILVVSMLLFLSSCAGLGVNGYRFSDEEMIERFKNVMGDAGGNRQIYEGENGVFDVRRKNGNYYVRYRLVPAVVEGVSLVIFDSAGEVVHAGWR